MKTCLPAIIGIAAIASVFVYAAKMPPAPGKCSMAENVSVSINFNGSDKDPAVVQTRLDDKVKEIKALAENEHFSKFTMQSNNFNISNVNNSGGGETTYQYNGNAGYIVLPAEKALDFMVVLTQKGYHVSVNMNRYLTGNCPR